MNRPRSLSIVFYFRSAMSDFSKKTRSPAAELRHHPYFRLGVENIPHIVVYMRSKTTDRKSSFLAKIRPNGRGQGEKSFGHIIVKLIRIPWNLKDMLRPFGNFANAFLRSYPLGQVAGG